MKTYILIFLSVLSFNQVSAQIQFTNNTMKNSLEFDRTEKYNRLFSDTLMPENFKQGFLDSQDYFIGTSDFFTGALSIYGLYIPSIIYYSKQPKDRRFLNRANPNVQLLNSDVNYYEGYKFGAVYKKRKRIVQGAITVTVIYGILIHYIIKNFSLVDNMNISLNN